MAIIKVEYDSIVGGGKNRLIYLDQCPSNALYWWQWYDQDCLEITAGALRTGPSANGDVTFTSKIKGTLHAYNGNAYSTSTCQLYINDILVSNVPSTSQQEVTQEISVGDTIRWVTVSHYKTLILLISE